MNEKVNAALEAAMEALREAEHQLRRAANAADPDECGPAADGPAAPYGDLANRLESLIEEVEDLQG